MAWKIISQKARFECPFLSLYEKVIATPSHPEGVHWYVVHRPQAVAIAPRTSGGDYILIRQERPPTQQDIWEFPAGQVDAEEEELLQTATRELAEEAGVATELPLIPLGSFFTSPGYSTEQCHLFLAEGVQPLPGGARPEATESILECRAFSSKELCQMVANGTIIDANTLAIFARLVANGKMKL